MPKLEVRTCCASLFLTALTGKTSISADREVQRILLELLNQMDGFDQSVNVKVTDRPNSQEQREMPFSLGDHGDKPCRYP